jgi:hypothetical protein
MEQQPLDQSASLTTRRDQPLIGLLLQEDNEEVVHYYVEEAEADAVNSADRIRDILKLAGVWSDLNWDEMEQGLYHIRHDSRPTPPLSL